MSHIIAHDQFWQQPAITELHAFRQIQTFGPDLGHCTYVAFPWATLIDYLQTGKSIPSDLIRAYQAIKEKTLARSRHSRLLTVCQHIYASRYTSLFKACGISDVYWPHLTISRERFDGLQWHPFPLYPVNHPNKPDAAETDPKQKRYKASFIGTYDPRYYISPIRTEIFKLGDLHRDDLLIVKRDNWHFQEEVYTEQLSGQVLSEEVRSRKHQLTANYQLALSESMFSLCPSGSGPNSIRLWESLAFRCIPIIFANDLALPGPIQAWIESCIFMDESSTCADILALIDAHSGKNQSELKAKRARIDELYADYGHHLFIKDILSLATSASTVHSFQRGHLNAADQPLTRVLNEGMGEADRGRGLLILDPGLKGVGSHHHKLNQAAAASIDHSVKVIANRLFKADQDQVSYEVIPEFEYSIYDEKADLSSNDYLKIVNSFTASMSRVLADISAACSLYCHTPSPAVVQSLACYLSSRKRCRLIDRVYIELMFGPSTNHGSDGLPALRLEARYQTGINQLIRTCQAAGIALTLATSNPIFREHYQNIVGEALQVRLHPHVFAHGESQAQATEPLRNQQSLLLHSGDPRPGKGLEWIGSSLGHWLEESPKDVVFTIHTGTLRFPDAFPGIAEAIETIRQASLRHPSRINLLEGYLDDEMWQKLLSESGAAALLHEPRFYGAKTSGNFFDMLPHQANGLKILLTQDTLSARILDFHEIGYSSFRYGDDAAFSALLKTPEQFLGANKHQGSTDLMEWCHGTSHTENLKTILMQ